MKGATMKPRCSFVFSLRAIAAVSLVLAFSAPLQAQTFRSAIQSLSKDASLTIARQEGNEALFLFKMENGTQRYVLVRQANDKPFMESIVEFRVPSLAVTDMPEGAECTLARTCMGVNNLVTVGFWAFDREEQCFAFIANYTGRQLAKMRGGEFRNILQKMTETVDAVEAVKDEIYSRQASGSAVSGESVQRGGDITPRDGEITLRSGGDMTLRGGGDITLRGSGDITLRSNAAGKQGLKIRIPE